MNAMILGIPMGFWREDWKHNFINALPMGVFAIANYCNQHGHNVLIANAAVDRNKSVAIKKIMSSIESTHIQVLGIPFHWHLCGFDILKTAEYVKNSLPEIKLILGGLTASIYRDEIMNMYPSIDGIVVGDGEVPFCGYLDELENSQHDPDLSKVPNLIWRRDGVVYDNGITYVASSEQLSHLDFSPKGTIPSMVEYANGIRLLDAVKGIPCDMYNQPTRDKLFFMNIGRGCSYNCVYCSGSKISYKHYFGRDRITVRSPASVVADFKRCYDAGFRRFHIGFDPEFYQKESYFKELFDMIGQTLGKDLHLLFEVYGLPSDTFLKSAVKNFAWVGIIFSPCFFGLGARRCFKGYSYSDKELEEKLREISFYGNCQGFVYYAVTCLENWTQDSINRRLRRIKLIQARHDCEITVLPIFAEPGSPWVSFPELFGERVFPFSFQDFYMEWKTSLAGWNDRLTGIAGTASIMRQFESRMNHDAADI